MLAELSNGDIWAAVITVSASILFGGLGMAWKLGALTQKVADFTRRLERVEKQQGPKSS